ncbi:AGAP012622-PA [Anopheles gambiae str. PEST]|uniref:AGAP012622-PA n=3 Tax=gambiae species complex TaxID=44542 RepID=Q7QN37_ANOGA|nr:AGAP012622-PA [Anopheles gambiae str. PEST]
MLFFKVLKHPLARGMVTYSVLWPTANLVQQSLDGRSYDALDFVQSLRYGLYGTFYVAPTIYGWVKITSIMWPKINLRTAMIKAIIEQATYGPFAGISFLYIMSLTEGKTAVEAVKEVKLKFPTTYTVGLAFWPFIQTINFACIPERNRVLFVATCSFVWTVFLASIKNNCISNQN